MISVRINPRMRWLLHTETRPSPAAVSPGKGASASSNRIESHPIRIPFATAQSERGFFIW